MKNYSLVLIPILLITLTLVVFWQVQRGDFILLDDDIHIQSNALLNPPSVENVKSFWTGPFQGLYIPITYSLWALQIKASGQYGAKTYNPWIFHFTNLILHTLNALLVYAILCLIIESPWAAFAGALLFAWHPVQVESAAWASGFKDLTGGFFSLLSIWFFLLYRRGRSYCYSLSTLAFVLALLSKPSSTVLPFFIWVIDYFFLEKKPLETLKALSLWLVLCVPIAWVTKYTQPDSHMRFIPTWWQRPLIAIDTIVFYVSKTLFPIFLAPDYSRTPQSILNPLWIGSLLFAFCCAGFLFWKIPKKEKALVLIFILGFVPVLGLVPFYFQFFSTVADRYLYLSMLAPALFIAFALQQKQKKALVTAIALLLASYAFLSWKQTRIWNNDKALFTHLTKVNRNTLLGHNNLGAILEREDLMDESLYHYAEALRIDPQSLPAHYNIGRVLGRMGYHDRAIYYLEKLLKMEYRIPDAHYTLGLIYNEKKDLTKAIQHYKIALQLNPDMVRGHYQLANSLSLAHKNSEAVAELNRVLKLDPHHTKALELLAKLQKQR